MKYLAKKKIMRYFAKNKNYEIFSKKIMKYLTKNQNCDTWSIKNNVNL